MRAKKSDIDEIAEGEVVDYDGDFNDFMRDPNAHFE